MSVTKGGKFISQGAYGCVYIPNIPTEKTKRSNRLVSKIIRKRDLDEEYGKIEELGLKNIDPNLKYLVYPIEKSYDVKYDKKHDRNLLDCNLDFKSGKVNIIMPNAGVDLRDYHLGKKEMLLPEFIDTLGYYTNLFEGLELLNKNGIIHRDIKKNNVVFDETTKQLRIIDFGLSTRNTNITDSVHSNLLHSPYFVWPMDYYIYHRLKKNSSDITPKYLTALFYSFDYIYGNTEYFFSKNKKYLDELYKFLKTTDLDSVKDDIFYKIDVFSLGYLLLDDFTDCMNKVVKTTIKLDEPSKIKDETYKILTSIKQKFYNILSNMMNFNPVKRWDISTASREYKKFLKNVGCV